MTACWSAFRHMFRWPRGLRRDLSAGPTSGGYEPQGGEQASGSGDTPAGGYQPQTAIGPQLTPPPPVTTAVAIAGQPLQAATTAGAAATVNAIPVNWHSIPAKQPPAHLRSSMPSRTKASWKPAGPPPAKPPPAKLQGLYSSWQPATK